MKQKTLRHVDFYFDFISPYSYLAVSQMAAFAKEHHVAFSWHPINLPKLIQLSGNVPPASSKNKALYLLRDLKRWAEHLNVPLRILRPGSFDSREALCMALSLQGEQRAQWCTAVFHAIWSAKVDPRQAHWMDDLTINLPEMTSKDTLLQHTEKAVQIGVFGAPTFILQAQENHQRKPQMFFGVDRMNFLASACHQ